MEILIFFENGKVKKFDTKALLSDYPEFEALRNPDIFNLLKVEHGGYRISWNEDSFFVKHNLLTTGAAATLLHCSRQSIENLIRRDKLQPVCILPNGKLFLRSEIKERIWQQSETL